MAYIFTTKDLESHDHIHIYIIFIFLTTIDLKEPPMFCCILYLPISFMAASLVLGQSCDCPSTSEVTLKDMEKIGQNQTAPKSHKIHIQHE